MKTETFFDGVAFDPAEPEKYAKSFAVNIHGVGHADDRRRGQRRTP